MMLAALLACEDLVRFPTVSDRAVLRSDPSRSGIHWCLPVTIL